MALVFSYLKTGIDGLDGVLAGGIRYPSDMAAFGCIGGGPGTGKTLLALEIPSRAFLDGDPPRSDDLKALRRHARATIAEDRRRIVDVAIRLEQDAALCFDGKFRFMVLDETDSGLDIDALRTVAEGVNALRAPDRGMLVITHYQRLLDYIKPDKVHVLAKGRIIKTGGPELAHRLEAEGYDGVLAEAV